jgi:carboxymethylenebutenolidase
VATHEDELGFLAWNDAASIAQPGVVMVPDVWGLSDHQRELASRLAAEGFAVLAIDPYRKTGAPRIASPAEAMDWIAGLSDPVVLDTIAEAAEALRAHPAVAGARIGITGFCMGGQYAILAACTVPGFSACAPFYGMVRYAEGLDPNRKPRSPLEALADRPCALLGFYGEQDHLIPPADVAAMREVLGATTLPGEVVLYAGAGHAFMNDTRPQIYRPEQAADAWGRLVPFLREHLAPA